MRNTARILAAFLFAALICRAEAPFRARDYFAIQVVDEQTGRGVPMVELKTTSCLSYYTDSAGYIAFYEPGLMDRTVWFDVASQGYEFPADAFGQRGVKLKTALGGRVQLKIKRINIAERLYRTTGEGIYRDTLLLGLKPPIDEPLLDAEVTGQDGILNTIYRGKLYWFYGDTLRASYSLGNYSMTGATTDLPEKIDPSIGFVLHYFTNQDGFTKPMAPIKGEGVVWLSGLVTLDSNMLAYYDRRRGLGEVLESGFVKYNPEKEQFEKLKTVPLRSPIHPQGYPFRVKGADGVDYIYFTAPYPVLRVRADMMSYLDLSSYESYTRANGKGAWTWKKHTPPPTPREQENFFHLTDAETGRPVLVNNTSCDWNEYRRRYIMIASQQSGATMLGEVWYSEAEHPEGPWSRAHKIITHANKPHDAHDFYNPSHHALFDQDGGRVIYLEGSYVNTFSGNYQTTPLYEYNQIMYRLDLSDPRLK